MKTITNALAKGTIAAVTAGALAVSSASPALARDHHDGGISAGEVIAGALVIGGIAAVVAASSDNDRDYRYNRAGYNDGYGRGDNGRGNYGRGGYNGNPRDAVQRCVQIAENQASRHSYGGRANVTDVRDVRQTRWGYEVRGRIAVNSSGRNWRNGDRQHGNGWGNDYRGWNSNMRGYDSGSFTCKVERGRVTDLDFSGIRGL